MTRDDVCACGGVMALASSPASVNAISVQFRTFR